MEGFALKKEDKFASTKIWIVRGGYFARQKRRKKKKKKKKIGRG